MNIRLIATDLDGTVAGTGGKISSVTRECVEACHKRGIPFVVCTGRWYSLAFETAQQLGLRGDDIIISTMGSHITTVNGKTLWCKTISRQLAHASFQIMQKYQPFLLSFTPNTLFSHTNPALPFYIQTGNIVSPLGVTRCKKDVSLEEFERCALDNCMKLEFMLNDAQKVSMCREELASIGMNADSHGEWNFELVEQGMGKGAGLLQLGKMLGISANEIMAFGDSANDLDMFRAAGWPVAVGNAPDNVKACAKIIAPPCEDNGVAQTIYKYVL